MDITTSEFATTQIPLDDLPLELERLSPAEGASFPRTGETPSGMSLHHVTALEEALFRPGEAGGGAEGALWRGDP